jgi:ethanolamine utilization protein EutQ (cupin superfamily)
MPAAEQQHHQQIQLRTPMTASLNFKPAFSRSNVNDFGPAQIEHRTAGSGLAQLGTYFMTFHETGLSDPWTVQYEETLYVIEGQARLVIVEGEDEQTLIGEPNELLILPKGTTVQYGALPGTRLLLSIAPVNWRDTVV